MPVPLVLETTFQDLRFGFRQLGKAPMLVAAAVLSLGLGIGANTAIFTLINAIMLQFLPVADPARLVLFYDDISTGVYSGNGFQENEFSYPFYEHLKAHDSSFTDLAAFRPGNDHVVLHVAGLHEAGAWEQATVHLVSGNYFRVLGVGAAAGRVLAPSDDSAIRERAAVISYDFWRNRFQLDPGIVGQTVVLNGTAFTIVGVAAREFFGERIQAAPDFWSPLSVQSQILKDKSYLTARDVYWLNCIGRLRPGVTLAGAQAAVNTQFQQFYLSQVGTLVAANKRREIEGVHLQLKPGGGGISGLRYLYSQPLHVLMAVVGVILLIACANVATLLLARASARRPEFLARLALGASRGRLLRQVLTESVLLSFLGGAAGIGMAWWSIKLLILLLGINAVVKVRPDPVALVFTLALCVVTGIVFGIFPALRFSRIELRPEGAAQPAGRGLWRLGAAQALIALQVALSLILLFGAGLLAHSLLRLERQDIGFQRENVLSIGTDASLAGYAPHQLFPLYREIGDQLSRLPGVAVVSVARFTPESGSSSSSTFSIEGYTARAGQTMNVHDVPVDAHFFEALRIPLLLGRSIDPRDTPASPAVAVVNQTFANLYFPNQNPLGRHMMIGSPFKAPGIEIVGEVADSRYYDLRQKAPPMVFFSLWQRPVSQFEIILKTTLPPLNVSTRVREALQRVSSKLPVLHTTTLNRQVEESLSQQKMITTLCGIFGALAIVLAAVGIYGTLAYAVAGRTSEIGVRMAIGAQRPSVVWLILRESLAITGLGLVLGLPFALSGARLLKSFLFGAPALDPVAIGSAAALIVTLSAFAGYLPARRASRIDPMIALRHE